MGKWLECPVESIKKYSISAQEEQQGLIVNGEGTWVWKQLGTMKGSTCASYYNLLIFRRHAECVCSKLARANSHREGSNNHDE